MFKRPITLEYSALQSLLRYDFRIQEMFIIEWATERKTKTLQRRNKHQS